MTTVDAWITVLSEEVPLELLRPAICRSLRERGWVKGDRGRLFDRSRLI